MDTLHDELDRSFGDGPPLAPVDNRLLAGRRALRRRRAATGVAGLAATAVLATGWYAVSPHTLIDSEQLALDPSDSGSRSKSEVAAGPSTAPVPAPWAERELIRYVEGKLEIRPKVIVHEHIKNPYGYASPGLSDALDVTWKGERQWLLINRDPVSGGALSASTPDNGWASFAAYVSDQVSGTGSGWPDTVRLTDQGEVVPTAGTRVLDRTDGLAFGPSFAPPGATSGAAIVSPAGEEERYFVVWRVLDGSLDVLTTGPDDVADRTLDELVADASAQYASGGGLR